MLAAAATPARETSFHVIAGGRLVAGDADEPIPRVVAVLQGYGISLAQVSLDEQRRVLAVDPCPSLDDQDAAVAAAALVEYCHAALRPRRS